MQVKMDSGMIENLLDTKGKLGYRVEAKLLGGKGKVFFQMGGSSSYYNELVGECNGHWDSVREALFSPSAHYSDSTKHSFRYYMSF